MEISFDEAVDYLKNGEEVTLECDGFSYEISQSDHWVGGDVAKGYISLVLGNVIYENVERVMRESINHLSKNGKKVIIII